MNILLFATAQYDREGLLTNFFLSEYNGKRIPDMNPNQTAQGSFLFDTKIIGLIGLRIDRKY